MTIEAILRTYNQPEILDLISKLAPFINNFHVVINEAIDTINTAERLKDSPYHKQIISHQLKNYGWSIALNTGIEALSSECNLVLAISNGVQLDFTSFEKLKDKTQEKRSSCGYSTFEDRREFSFKVPRNTCALWNRQVFNSVGLFDESLDSAGGMEDYDLTLKAYIQEGLFPRLGVKNLRNISYHAISPKKLYNESEAIKSIESRYSEEKVSELKTYLENQLQ